MSKRFLTYFGVPVPPFKEEKIGAGSVTIRFVVTGKIPSKKNNQMSKFTASKAATLSMWIGQLKQPIRTIRCQEIYENGVLKNTRTNIELNNQHPMRGYSLKDNYFANKIKRPIRNNKFFHVGCIERRNLLFYILEIPVL